MSLETHQVGNALRGRYWGPQKPGTPFHLWRPIDGPLVLYGLFEKIIDEGRYSPAFTILFNTLDGQQTVNYTCLVELSRCHNPDVTVQS